MSAQIAFGKIPPSAGQNGRVFDDARKLLSEIITHCSEFDGGGEWKLTPINQVRWRSDGRFKVRVFNRLEVIVVIRPGQLDSCWEYSLHPPRSENILVVGRVLSLWNGWTGRGIPEAYFASQMPVVPAKTDDDPPAKNDPPAKKGPLAVPKKPPEDPIKAMDITARTQPKPPDPLAAIRALTDKLSQLQGLQSQVAVLLTQRDNLAAEADRLLNEVDALDAKIAALNQTLSDPESIAVMTAATTLSKIMSTIPSN